jgi:hypothetical protein
VFIDSFIGTPDSVVDQFDQMLTEFGEERIGHA